MTKMLVLMLAGLTLLSSQSPLLGTSGEGVSQKEVVNEATCTISKAELLLNLIKIHKADGHETRREESFLYGEMLGMLVTYSLLNSNSLKSRICEIVYNVEALTPRVLSDIAEEHPDLKPSIDECMSSPQ